MMMEAFLNKKHTKYDLYIYENSFLSEYSPYLLDLTEYISKDILDMYDPKIISELCMFDDKLIGLVSSY